MTIINNHHLYLHFSGEAEIFPRTAHTIITSILFIMFHDEDFQFLPDDLFVIY